MDQAEYLNEQQLEVAIRRGHDLVKSQIWTALPVKIVSVNMTEQSCVVQPLIQGKKKIIQNGQETWIDFDYPQIRDVPVQFPSGGGWSITFPLKPGDEGTVQFQSRCIDNWWLPQQGAAVGSTQPQAEMRMHNWNDCVFHPGARSKPRWLQNVSTSNVQLRADDGMSYIELTGSARSGGGGCNLVFPGGVTITAPTVHIIGGELRADKEITAQLGGASVTVSKHMHNQPPDSHGDIEQPTDAPTPGS